MGSSRARIVQQLLTESLLLAVAGGAAGVGFAVLMIKGLLAFLPEGIGGFGISSSPDPRMLAISLGLSLLTGTLFGLAPALQSTCPDIARILKDQAASVTGGAAQVSFRKALVAAQVTLSLLLLIGASLFIRSLANLYSLDPGFRTQSLVQFQLSLDSIGYDLPRAHAFYRQLEKRLRALPGVRSAGIANLAVLSGDDWENAITVAGHQAKPGEENWSFINVASPGYFETLGVRLLAGRAFRENDTATAPKIAIVNRSFAKHYFDNESAVGRRFGRGDDPSTPTDIEIVGVVNDMHYQSLREKIQREVFLCGAQAYQFDTTVYVNVEQNPKIAFNSIRRLVHDMEPNAPIMAMKTTEHQLEESLVTERMIATLSTGFSILATALSVIGLYGVMAYMVTQRSREIGIRMALGAMSGNVIWLVMREVSLLVAIGITVALPIAFGSARFVQSELFGIKPTDAASIASAVLLLAGVALFAGYVPARRAASSDPLRILRYE
jgi:predicted permease